MKKGKKKWRRHGHGWEPKAPGTGDGSRSKIATAGHTAAHNASVAPGKTAAAWAGTNLGFRSNHIGCSAPSQWSPVKDSVSVRQK
ncbi:predicted protein [Chaetomium globosum CBS 148.51]|uniref:Uncharacterized protein n=1 Tax=Chaetomium globosum (strain ATCC 6205 / CBS 148.51 / DSM 1962 / NBRC 6347 / NRRL 1970) TaxID=306901 RepID=Q2H3R0_CHAGB|nr:uncharacterized protein CHGG_06705 [Chaetomium globosum CBS 148.51]EAQ90086.1 predicted protein [Chaetomium globosum CBS 148.51]